MPAIMSDIWNVFSSNPKEVLEKPKEVLEASSFLKTLYNKPLGTNLWHATQAILSGLWKAGPFRATLQLGLPVAGLSYASYKLGEKAITTRNEKARTLTAIGCALSAIWGVAELVKGYNILSCAGNSTLTGGLSVFTSCMV
ncbi:MAG: hypothetical protein KR126chlam4_00396 [Candidatus Anoxychlamydiales bacterium]|uniref:Uncharacterized protein n=1 Tax=marine sediment metagenome TaxID=412755 RepID=A0A0F9AN42_9ZZZZ|nr:hypothetical protein [Candidatus Anoxychlamydiales bacterium]NGX40574.1 hypothetical protein [Candidatus Anoxychlamydiales bacterium]HEU64196.1 hypothetical protein [Chlamydiota bacterium]